jgi:hypothetical protein
VASFMLRPFYLRENGPITRTEIKATLEALYCSRRRQVAHVNRFHLVRRIVLTQISYVMRPLHEAQKVNAQWRGHVCVLMFNP